MALMHTLLPEPVAPAISRWGISARSTAIGWPDTSSPRAMASGEMIALNALDSITPRSDTRETDSLGTSRPTTDRPGTGASMRMGEAARARARSFCQAGDLVDPHPLLLHLAADAPLDVAGVQAKLGDGRPLVDLDDLGRHAKAGQGLFDDARLAAARRCRRRRAATQDPAGPEAADCRRQAAAGASPAGPTRCVRFFRGLASSRSGSCSHQGASAGSGTTGVPCRAVHQRLNVADAARNWPCPQARKSSQRGGAAGTGPPPARPAGPASRPAAPSPSINSTANAQPT